jgi:hypothetical protein
VLGDRLTDDGTQRWLAARRNPLGSLAEGLPDAGRPATALDDGRGSADHCRGQVVLAIPRPGTARAHLRVVAMQGRVARVVVLAGLTWRVSIRLTPCAPDTAA